MVSLLLAIIYLAFISLGLPDSLLGSAWPSMHLDLEMPLSAMGILTMIICIGTIISSLFSDKLERKITTPFVISISVLLTAGAMLGFSFANQFWVLCLLAIPYGLGAGAIDASLNNYVSLHYSTKQMSWLHAFWGVGAVISPYIMSYALTYHSSWQMGYRLVSYIQFGLTLLMVLSTPLWFKVKKKDEEKGQVQEVLTFRQKFAIPGIFFVMFGFFAYCSLEASGLYWASSFMVSARGIDEKLAAALGSLMYLGMTLGRLLNGFIPEKFRDENRIRFSMVIAGIGIILLMIPIQNVYLTGSGFVILGLGCGPIYPSIIHSTPDHFGETKSSAVIGLQMASAYVGSTFMPPLFGLIAQYVSVEILPYYLLVFLLFLLLMLELLNHVVSKRKKEETRSLD